MYYNRDATQSHYAKWKKPEVEDHRLHHFIFMKWTEKANLYIERKQIGSFLHLEMETRINCKWALSIFFLMLYLPCLLEWEWQNMCWLLSFFPLYAIWSIWSKWLLLLEMALYFWSMIPTFFRLRIIRIAFVWFLGFLLPSRSLFPCWNSFKKHPIVYSLQHISVWGHLHFFKNISSYLWSRFFSTYQSIYSHWIHLSPF